MSAYDDIVARFREITNKVHDNGFCCARVIAGAPECCAFLPTTQDLTFTAFETYYLPVSGVFRQPLGSDMLVLDREKISPAEIRAAVADGWLANTLECASHPTRPIVLQDGTVVGVVVIDACNADIAMTRYRLHREELTALWQAAVNMTSVKDYYVTWGIKKGWTVL